MKRLTFFIGLLLTFNNLVAQKIVTKNYTVDGISEAYFDFKFAKNIELKNWSKNNVQVVAEVSLNENKANDKFVLKQDNVGRTLKIKSDYSDFFEKHNKSNIVISGDCNSYKYCRNHNKIEVNYMIYVPENLRVKLKSISGDIAIDEIKNEVEVDLVSGNINVKKASKNMDLVTVSGDIDIALKDATFKAQTVTGTVYSDLDIDFKKGARRNSNKIYGTIASGNSKLRLKTVSGDVLLRKQ